MTESQKKKIVDLFYRIFKPCRVFFPSIFLVNIFTEIFFFLRANCALSVLRSRAEICSMPSQTNGFHQCGNKGENLL